MSDRSRHVIARTLRIALRIVAIVVVVVAVSGATLLLQPVRNRLLAFGLDRIQTSLPGTFEVGDARWNTLGSIDLDHLYWTDSEDTLVALERFALAISLRRLITRRLVVRECAAVGLYADVPAIRKRFPATGDGAARTSVNNGGGFLRPGAVPRVPAIAFEHVEISASRIILSGDGTVTTLEILGAIDLLDGRPPSIDVEKLYLADSNGRFGIDEARLHVDINSGVLTGDGRGRISPGLSVSFDLNSFPADSVLLHVTLADSARVDTQPIALNVQARLSRKNLDVRSVGFQVGLDIPGSDYLPSAIARRVGRAGSFAAFEVGASGRYERHDGSSSRLMIRVEERPLFGGLDAQITFREAAVEVDTLTARIQQLVVGVVGAVARDGKADVSVDARGVVNGMKLTELRGRMVATSITSAPYNVDLLAVVEGLKLETRAVVERPDGWLIKLQPLLVSDADAGAPSRTSMVRPGEIGIGTNGNVKVRRLVVAGTAGRYVVNGSLSPGRRGMLRVDADWSQPPEMLLGRLLPDAKKRSEVVGAWPREVRAKANLAFDLSSGNRELNGTLQLMSPGWIDSSLVRVQVRGEDIDVDSALVAMPGLRIRARGKLSSGEWNGGAGVAWDVGGVAERLAPGLAGLAGEADVYFKGGAKVPHVRAAVRAAYESGGTRVPSIVATADWQRERLRLRMSCPSGVASGPLLLDSLTTSFDSYQKELFPAQVTVRASGSDLKYAQRMQVGRSEEWVLDTDSLMVELMGQRLRAPEPFRVRFHPGRSSATFEDLVMSGSLGTVRATGVAQPDSSHLEVRIDVELPPKPASLTLPDELWPGSFELSLTARGRRGVTGSLIISEIDLGQQTDLTVTANATGVGDSIVGELSVSGADVDVVSGAFQFPGTIDVFPPRWRIGDGPVSVLLNLKDFPVPNRRGPLLKGGARHELARLGGKVWIEGSAARPQGRASIVMGFPAASPLAKYRIEADAALSSWARPAEKIAAANSGNLATFLTQLDPSEAIGLVAAGRVLDGDEPVAEGAIHLPVDWTIYPPATVLRRDRGMVLRCSSPRLVLAGMAPFLPEDVGLEGLLEFDVSATGPIDDLVLAGGVSGKGLKYTHANGSRVAANATLKLAGTGKEPSIGGEVQIVNGIITVPEAPQNLHPSEGESMLWRTMDARREEEAAVTTADSAAARAYVPRLNLDVSILIPSSLWIRGKGLDVELAGNLTLTHQDEAPTIAGELKAVRGQLLFLGRNFLVSRGTAVFYGDDNINPSLDLELTTTVEGVLITVQMVGTAEKPEVQLTSEPSMSEGDIMSFLVFGKRMDELNSDQIGLVQQRAAETAATFGTQLASRLSRQMGVDLLTLSRGKATGQSTLTIGKYVTRRALLKYEQSLEERASFLIDLEYFLTRTLRLETFIGQQQQSGLEINWVRDY